MEKILPTPMHPKWAHSITITGKLRYSIGHRKLKQCDFTHVVAETLVLKFGFWFYSPSLWGKRVYK